MIITFILRKISGFVNEILAIEKQCASVGIILFLGFNFRVLTIK